MKALLERLWDYSSIEVSPAPAARAVLGSAEAVVRREIVAGRIDSLPRLLPDFTYGAMVPFVGQEDALKLSRQARELLAGTPLTLQSPPRPRRSRCASIDQRAEGPSASSTGSAIRRFSSSQAEGADR
jgi:hypothetical protein